MAVADYLDQVQKLYIAYFGRPADPLGLSYWANQVNAAGGNMAVAIAGFAASTESTALFGSLPSAQKISAIYLNLFNRLPESTGLSYWMNQLDSGVITQAQAAWQIMNQAGAGDATSIANKLAMANLFTAQVDTTAEIAGYNGTQPAAYGRAYLSGVDATAGSVSNATAALNNSVGDATGVHSAPPVVTTPPPTSTFGVTKDGSNIASFTNAGANITVTNAGGNSGGTDTFTSSTGTATLGTPIAGYVVPTGSTLTIASALAANTSFSGAGSSVIVASASGEDLTGLNASGESVIQLTTGQAYSLNIAEAGLARIGAGGTKGTLTDAGVTTVVDSLGNFTAGVATQLLNAGADKRIAIVSPTGADLTTGGIDITGLTGLSLTSGQNYTLTLAEAAISQIGVNGTPGVLGSHGAGTIAVVDSLANLSGNTGTLAGADSVTATLGTTTNIAALDTSGITRLALSSNQGYTMTGAQAGTIDTTQTTTGVSVTLTTAASGQTLAANVQGWTLADVTGNSVTLGAAAQNVGDGNASNNVTLAIGSLAPTGTWALHGTADTLTASSGANLSGINGGGVTTAENLTLTGTTPGISMTAAQYAGLTGTLNTQPGASVSITDGGSITGKTAFQTYNLGSGGANTFTVNTAAAVENINGASNSVVTVNLSGTAPTGTWALSNASDSININGNSSIAAVTLASATNLNFTAASANTLALTTAQYQNLTFSAITAGNTASFSSAGSITALSGSSIFSAYGLASTGGSTITLSANTAANVTGSGAGDTIAVGTGTYTGNWALGSTNERLAASGTVDVTGVNSAAALHIQGLTLNGAITMTSAQYNGLTNGVTVGSGGTAAGNTVTITNSGTLTDSASVDNYVLSTTSFNTFNIVNNAAIHVKDVSNNGGSTYNIKVATFTGNLELNASSAIDAVGIATGSDISGGTITGTAHRAKLIVNGTGGAATVTVNADEAAVFHASPLAFTVNNATSATMNIANTGTISLGGLESALTTVGVQAGSTVNISVGASTVGAGFSKTVNEIGSAGGTLFAINNGGATLGSTTSDSTHYATITNFNSASDRLSLKLTNVQQSTEQDIDLSLGAPVALTALNSVIVAKNLSLASLVDATALASQKANIQSAINATGTTTGNYSFVIDSNQGAAVYEIHYNAASGGSVDGIQLVGVVSGLTASSLQSHVTG